MFIFYQLLFIDEAEEILRLKKINIDPTGFIPAV